jgi:hypothetical protein
MTEQERLDELGPVVEAQRAICHRLHDEWSAACKVLHGLEREQSAIFRSVSDEAAARSLLEAKGYSISPQERDHA